jgi:hypothetical protein
MIEGKARRTAPETMIDGEEKEHTRKLEKACPIPVFISCSPDPKPCHVIIVNPPTPRFVKVES